MARWFLQLMHELGTGRALENARREQDETARTLAGIALLEARMAALHAPPERAAA